MKKIFLLLAVTISTGVLFAACGGNGQATVLSPEEQAVINEMRGTESLPPQNNATSVVDETPVTSHWCEMTAKLQGRWEIGEIGMEPVGELVGELEGAGSVIVFEGNSIVEYRVLRFNSDRVLTQEDLDNNTPFYSQGGSSAGGWVFRGGSSMFPWDNSGAVQRELISAEPADGNQYLVTDGNAGKVLSPLVGLLPLAGVAY